eukprot:scaffold1188_cov255-Pinguiococcus_pyrenoidosus.AAC.6
MQIPFFIRRCQSGIFFEFRRCWFMKGKLNDILQALCEASKTARAIPVVTEFLHECCARSAVEAATGSSVERNSALTVLVEAFRDGDVRRNDLLFIFALASTYGAGYEEHLAIASPSLAAILANYVVWATLLERFASAATRTRLDELVAAVKDQLVGIAGAVAEDQLGLRELHVVFNAKDRFFDLLNCSGAAAILSPAVLGEREQRVKDFDLRLAHVQCYTNFFCGCGIKIDVGEVRSRIEGIRKNYDLMKVRMHACEFRQSLPPFLTPCSL